MSMRETCSTAVLLYLLWAGALAVDPHGAHLRWSHGQNLQVPDFVVNLIKAHQRCKGDRGLPHGVLCVADPDEVAPVEIMLCGAISVDALFSSSRQIRTTLSTGWGKGVANFTTSADGKSLLQHLQALLAPVQWHCHRSQWMRSSCNCLSGLI